MPRIKGFAMLHIKKLPNIKAK